MILAERQSDRPAAGFGRRYGFPRGTQLPDFFPRIGGDEHDAVGSVHRDIADQGASRITLEGVLGGDLQGLQRNQQKEGYSNELSACWCVH